MGVGAKVPETVPFMLTFSNGGMCVCLPFFDNCIGWEGIRWWRFCVLFVRGFCWGFGSGGMVIGIWMVDWVWTWFACLIVMIGSVSDLSL
jgi:hypothetical protein